MQVANYENNIISLYDELDKYPRRDLAITEIRKKGRKYAYKCPFCDEYLILRAGHMYEPHFAHKQGKSCTVARSYEQYEQQGKKESAQHSVIRDVIYDDLRTQEKYKPDLKVEHGYKAKAEGSWKVVPDIVVKKGSAEFGISILTNVYQKGDDSLVKIIRKRNQYFTERGLNNIWFIEDQKQSLDLSHRVFFLWESETLLSAKTAWDLKWDELLNKLTVNDTYSISEVFNYNEKEILNNDVRSLYYVHSSSEGISFSVHRVILDELESPYRAFAVTTGYKMQLTDALVIQDYLQLSNDDYENRQMSIFKSDFAEGINRLMQNAEGQLENIKLKDNTKQAEQNGKQKDTPKDLPVIYWDDGTVTYLVDRLKSKYISEEDAALLAQYLRHNRELVIFKGWDLRDIQKLAVEAMGKISDSTIRTHLGEIVDL
ncbi:competence protein CoiA family protein [Paenibacillus sp. 276b]|uniref:competence protein CoiA family protein n=1 Tax=Paenibacillus sp. 276b TaxID=1566277 RepID=UPI0008964D59|nr:competence protein CoiA family protein [Paenibacillus sp. 276b]SEB27565.1 Competence protein CoiA-like family protein [Paenibacillus sp. 276b]